MDCTIGSPAFCIDSSAPFTCPTGPGPVITGPFDISLEDDAYGIGSRLVGTTEGFDTDLQRTGTTYEMSRAGLAQALRRRA